MNEESLLSKKIQKYFYIVPQNKSISKKSFRKNKILVCSSHIYVSSIMHKYRLAQKKKVVKSRLDNFCGSGGIQLNKSDQKGFFYSVFFTIYPILKTKETFKSHSMKKRTVLSKKLKTNKNYFPLNPHFEKKEITILLLELIWKTPWYQIGLW